MTTVFVALIRYYQRHFRHLHNRCCIYQPTCSDYTILAIETFGLLHGLWYGWLRVRRCNGALYAGGEDWPTGKHEAVREV